MSIDLIKAISNLSDDDFQQVQQLIITLANKNKPLKKRGRPKKVVVEDLDEEVADFSNEDEDEAEEVQEVQPQKRRVKTLTASDTTTVKKQPKTLAFQKIKNRPNLFLKSAVSKLHKEDTKIDKKLRGNNDLEPRGTRIATINVICSSCGKSYDVSPKVVHSAPHEGKKYICNNCALRTRRTE